MLILDTAERFEQALAATIDPTIKTLLRLRRDQLLSDTGGDHDIAELALFVIVDPPDRLAEIETRIGFPIFTERVLEWVQRHGAFFEAVAILDDFGFGVVAICPDQPDADHDLLAILRDEAMRPSSVDLPTV